MLSFVVKHCYLTTNKYRTRQLTIMSKDIDTEYVGVRIPRQILEKIDERVAMTGLNRQDVVKNALVNELFQGC